MLLQIFVGSKHSTEVQASNEVLETETIEADIMNASQLSSSAIETVEQGQIYYENVNYEMCLQ